MGENPRIGGQGGTRRRARGWTIGWIALMLGICFPYFEATRNANERPRLLQAMALVEEGRWAIDGPTSRGLASGPDVSRSRVNGRLYPNKPPGTTLVAAVAYGAARNYVGEADLTLRTVTWWARLFGGWAPTIILVWFLLRRYAPVFGPRPATAAVVMYALGTPAASYAHLLYGHQLAAALLGIGLALLLDAGSSSSIRRSVGLAVGGGLLAAAAVVVEYGAVFAALPIAGVLGIRLFRPGGAKIMLAALGSALLPMIGLAAYHRVVFGSVGATGYHHVTNAEFAAKHGQGFLGLSLPRWDAAWTHLLSADGGLLWWAPTVVLSLYGLGRLSLSEDVRSLREEARVHGALVVLYMVMVCSLSFDGGWRVGPRYMVVVFPSLVMGWAYALRGIRRSVVGMGLVVSGTTYAVLVNGLAANLWPHFDLNHVHQPVAEVLLPLWEQGYRPYGGLCLWLGRSGLAVVLGGSVAGTWFVLFRLGHASWRMTISSLIGLIVGFLLVGMTRWYQPHPRGKQNLAYIETIWEPTGTQQSMTKRLKRSSLLGRSTDTRNELLPRMEAK